jgi:hypothetical protein
MRGRAESGYAQQMYADNMHQLMTEKAIDKISYREEKLANCLSKSLGGNWQRGARGSRRRQRENFVGCGQRHREISCANYQQ